MGASVRRVASTPRPRDRRAQIIVAASTLFVRDGYARVGMGDIAAAVGITPGALYRHFDSKQALVADAVIDSFDRAMGVIGELSVGDLDGTLAGIADTAAARRDLGVLWNREARFLDDANRHRMRARFFEFVTALTDVVAAARPALDRADADLVTWAAIGVLTSASYHSTEIPEPRLAAILTDAARRVCRADLTHLGEAPAATAVAPAASRRESLLDAASALFGERGYAGASLADIGSAVGVSNTAVYRHFASKADMLEAVADRAIGPIRAGLDRALTSERSARACLSAAIRNYSGLALAHPDLVGVLISELDHLPDGRRRALRHDQRAYVDTLISLLASSRPRLDPVNARFRVHAGLTAVNDVARTAHLRHRADIGAKLPVLALRAIG